MRDLLNPAEYDEYSGLRVREHPVYGPYVDGLKEVTVTSISDTMFFIELGNKTRTVGSTNMNESSSRSHAIFTIDFVQSTHGHGDVNTAKVRPQLLVMIQCIY